VLLTAYPLTSLYHTTGIAQFKVTQREASEFIIFTKVVGRQSEV